MSARTCHCPECGRLRRLPADAPPPWYGERGIYTALALALPLAGLLALAAVIL